MDLGSGEVDLPIRVDPALTDPRSEVGQVGHALNHMLNNVEGALESRQQSEVKVRQFVADASHELRNPLASIRGYAELTRRRRGEMCPESQFAMDRIESEATRMSALVEDMLLLARLDNDQKLELAPIDLVEVVLNAVSDAQAAGSDHIWTLDVPNEEITVMADADRLMQVVVNVLSNARKHTPAGVTVHTTVTARDGQAVVAIADNRIGHVHRRSRHGCSSGHRQGGFDEQGDDGHPDPAIGRLRTRRPGRVDALVPEKELACPLPRCLPPSWPA